MISRLPPPRQTTFIRIIGFEYLHSHSRIEGRNRRRRRRRKKRRRCRTHVSREEIVSSSNWMRSQNELRGTLSHYPFSSQTSEFFVSSFQFFFPPSFVDPSSTPPPSSPLLIERLHGPPRLADSFPFQA